ncbi:Type 1 glutamine amidotransferase-like domain-containing protein [Candidatus Saccharibacteria bacterium]|nr:Type 1 glutamine amidotransferase-like domain-containing protein [Candidatus Saccharibacteria bacterium]
MRMYLSSYSWGNKPEKMFELVVSNKKHVGIIANAADQFPEDGIIERLKQDQTYLAALGITSERLDLRDYFGGKKEELQKKLEQFDLVWVRGGNVFVLRRAMKQSGFNEIITELLKNDEIAYGGFSAGACVMGSTLHGLELVDNAHVVPRGYISDIIWDGLNILPYAFAPHYNSDHPESSMINEAVEYFEKHHIPYKALRDGEAILINRGQESVVS